MALEIIWTKRASNNFENILKYLETSFGYNTAKVFAVRSYKIINNLTIFPRLGTSEVTEKNIRGIVLSKHIKLFYRLDSNFIVLLAFFDTRQNLKSIRL